MIQLPFKSFSTIVKSVIVNDIEVISVTVIVNDIEIISVRDLFCFGGGGGGGLRSLAGIFSPSLARISSGFGQILFACLPQNGNLYIGGGGGGRGETGCNPLDPPPPRLVRLCFNHSNL